MNSLTVWPWFAAAVALSLIVIAVYRHRLYRLAKAVTLFSPRSIVDNFRNMHRIYPTTVIRKAPLAFQFERGQINLPQQFDFRGQKLNTRQFIEETRTTGLLVLHADRIVWEEYRLGQTAATTCISWSVAKSIVSGLFGIAMKEGHIRSIQDSVTDYVPELKNSGYDEVRIKDVLQMSSGVAFNEDYMDFRSDISRLGRVLALGGSLDLFAASLKREHPPGSRHHYVSVDTHVLAMILTRSTRRTIADYLQEKIWQKIGTEADAYWITDNLGVELALGGLNATLRDYARIGRLFLRWGNWNGEQIIPAQWIQDSITPDAAHLMPGENELSDNVMGYGYQWWIPEHPQGDYVAIGIYNQFIYIHPGKNLVIAKTSANHHYSQDTVTSEHQSVALFQAIANSL